MTQPPSLTSPCQSSTGKLFVESKLEEQAQGEPLLVTFCLRCLEQCLSPARSKSFDIMGSNIIGKSGISMGLLRNCYNNNHINNNWVPELILLTVVLEKTLESPLDSKEIQPVNPKGNQPWVFIGRTDAEAEAPILWPLDGKNQLIGKDPGAGKDWGQEEKGMAEDEMLGWHHQFNGLESEQTPADS